MSSSMLYFLTGAQAVGRGTSLQPRGFFGGGFLTDIGQEARGFAFPLGVVL
jgi:hypothetical protein